MKGEVENYLRVAVRGGGRPNKYHLLTLLTWVFILVCNGTVTDDNMRDDFNPFIESVKTYWVPQPLTSSIARYAGKSALPSSYSLFCDFGERLEKFSFACLPLVDIAALRFLGSAGGDGMRV